MRLLFAIPLLLASTLTYAEIQKQSMDIVCGTTDEIVDALKTKYKENVIWVGKEDNGIVVSTWMNRDKSTFSVLKTTVNGKISCLIAAGSIPSSL